jgi:hypothetical protein
VNALQLAGGAIGAAGFFIFGFTLGWLPALGLFLALFGYGIQMKGIELAERRAERSKRVGP